jgi:hypothetical protein
MSRRRGAISEAGLSEGCWQMTDPFDPSAWPSYPIGPRDSVFALGVASVNYAGLEFALGGIFATVTGLTMNAASVLLPNITNHLRLQVTFGLPS